MASSLIFGRALADDFYNNLHQTDNSTVFITPRYNTADRTELKIGLLLPFSQKDDNLTAQIVWGGSSAIRMAVNDINNRQVIPGAYITLIEKDSFPDSAVTQMSVTNAVYASVTLLQQGVIGVIGDISSSWTSLSALMTSTLEIPQCSFTANAIAFSDKTQYKYFFRTIPTQVITADVMLSFSAKQGWSKLGVLYTDDPLGQQFYQRALIQAGQMNLHILQYQAIAPSLTSTDIMNALRNVTNGGARIIMIAATGTPSSQIMMQAYEMGLINKDYVWLMMGDTTKELKKGIETHNKNNTEMIDYKTAYNGLFFFDDWLSLNGYTPFEHFLDQWSTLDPLAYPYAGQRNISSYEGLAYSCMMVMAEGFGKVIKNSNNQTNELLKLSKGELGDKMLPSAFNVGYVGPDGPMIYDSNGDLTTGNYLVYNLQQGVKSIVGKSTGGILNITNEPIYFDGTHQPPLDSPPSVALNPDISSPISHAVLVLSSAGILFSVICFFIVLFNRKHEVFKAASPLFCCLELVGFVFTYISVVMMIGIPTTASCIVTPITFSLGFLLILGNMIAKNYRIYRIFNNIFITRNVITDKHLIKTVFILVSIEMLILVIGLVVARPVPTKFEVSFSTHYWSCEPSSNNSRLIFLIPSTIYAAGLLIFATFLAYKTRFAGRQYNKYSECKQMGLSVYNILFSALVGFAVMVNPLADFYTKYYIEVISVLWATTFSLLILFVPKLQAFYVFIMKQRKKTTRKSIFSFLKSSSNVSTQYNEPGGISELLSLEQILASDEPVLDDASLRRRKPSTNTDTQGGGYSNFIEVHEGEMPIRKVFRYFPFLSQWEMHHIMVFPWLGYFSHFSKYAKKGTVMSYYQASIYSSKPEDYVLRIHGQGWHDMYIQLPNLNALHTWEQCFNQKKPDYLDVRRKTPTSETTSRQIQEQIPRELLESSLSQDHLLGKSDDEDSSTVNNNNTTTN